jgi:hypothetical protein
MRGSKALLIAASLFAVFAAQTAIAKEPRIHHSQTVEKHAKAKAETTKAGNGESAKGESPAGTQSGDKLDAAIPISTSRATNAADKTRNPPISVKFAKPITVQTHSVGLPESGKSVTRNAIGEIVGQHVTAPITTSRNDAAHIAAMPTVNLTVGRQPPHLIAGPANPDRSKVDGSHLIRTTMTSGLGGPAKSTTGINGTTIRPKY